MKKIHVLVTGAHDIGTSGLSTIIFRWGMTMERDIVYCYLMPKGAPDELYKNRIIQNGDKILIPPQGTNKLNKLKWILRVMRNEENDLLHINQDRAYIALAYILIARLCGINRVMCHSHNSSIDCNNYIKRKLMIVAHYICRPFIVYMSTELLSCSYEAAKWMFGAKIAKKNRYIKIYNGVDRELFKYSNEERKRYRKEYGLREIDKVFGTVGRLSAQKNLFFLIDRFNEFKLLVPNSYLYIVGDGPLKKQLQEYINKMNLKQSVFLLGKCQDVEKLLSFFDVFVLASQFEGLPLVLVEAQMELLPCVVSDTVTKEVNISNNYVSVNLNEPKEWLEAFYMCSAIGRTDTILNNEKVFNIRYSAEQLCSIYKRMINE